MAMLLIWTKSRYNPDMSQSQIKDQPTAHGGRVTCTQTYDDMYIKVRKKAKQPTISSTKSYLPN